MLDTILGLHGSDIPTALNQAGDRYNRLRAIGLNHYDSSITPAYKF
ncbi:hypothetical protein [Paraferrimonas sp. SM1919]|nr:hypothetical protein [Paraferrimonas sp. SM1919]